MRRIAIAALAASLLVAGCGGGGGGGAATAGEEAFPAATEPSTPPIPADTVPVETGPSGATGGAGGGGAGGGEAAPDDSVVIEQEGLALTLVALSETETFMTIATEGVSGTATIRRGTCASPGEVFHDVGELVVDGTTDVFLPTSVQELTGGDYVLVVEGGPCVPLTEG